MGRGTYVVLLHAGTNRTVVILDHQDGENKKTELGQEYLLVSPVPLLFKNTNARIPGVTYVVKQSLKQGVAVGFLLLLCIKAWVMPLLYLDYELRKEFIIDNFCVNKDRPELHCDGKCYLATRLAAVQKQEQQQAERSFMFKLLENITDCQTFFASFSAPDYVADKQTLPTFHYVSPFFHKAALSGIFHPPQLG